MRRTDRHRRYRMLLLAAAVLAAIVALPGSAAATANVQIGIEQPGNMEDPHYLPMILDTQRDYGAKVIRYTARMSQVATCDPAKSGGAAPTSPDNSCYDWHFIDNVVSGANARGMQTLLSVYGTPRWEFGQPENWTGATDAEFGAFVADVADFTQAAATRYDGRHGQPRVSQWTIWNEPNGPFFEPRVVAGTLVGPKRYAKLYDAAARRIKAVDPTTRVAVGPTAPHAASLPPIRFTTLVLPELQALGSPIDAWGHNAYMGAQDPYSTTIVPPYVGLGNLKDLTDLLDQYPVTRGKPIWVTEFGYQTAGVQKAVTLEQQATLTASVMRFIHEEPRLETFIWYQLHDDDPTGLITSFQTGLFKDDQQICGGGFCPKPAAEVFRRPLWVSPVSGGQVTLWGQGRIKPAVTRIYVRGTNVGWRAYGNADTATSGIVSVRVPWIPGMQAMTCDTACGLLRDVTLTVGGGGGDDVTAKHVTVQQLEGVTLNRRASLARGIYFDVKCTKCTVRARIVAVGAASRLASARTKQVVVARSKMSPRPKNRVMLKFTGEARRGLAKVKTSTVTLRIYIRFTDGTAAVSERPITLN